MALRLQSPPDKRTTACGFFSSAATLTLPRLRELSEGHRFCTSRSVRLSSRRRCDLHLTDCPDIGWRLAVRHQLDRNVTWFWSLAEIDLRCGWMSANDAVDGSSTRHALLRLH